MAKTGRQTPTTSALLAYTKSKGGEACFLYRKTGKTPMKWQEMLIRDMMATRKDGLWTHTKFGYSLPRRNGKSELVVMRELWGLVTGERIMHTAHRTTTTHAIWEKLLDMVERLAIPCRSIRAAGRELIELPDSGGRIEFRTRTTKSGLGEGVDLLVIDEAQEYTLDQESALKYIVTDSANPQTVFCGTPPTPTSIGTVFTDLRRRALAGKAENTGWAEWSVEEQTLPKDKGAWYETNPSLGTIFTERDITDEIGSDAVDFNIQRLGLWIKYSLKSAISASEWEALRVPTVPALSKGLYAGIKFGRDGKNAALSVAARTKDGKIFVEAIDCRPVRAGNSWLLSFLKKADLREVVVDGAGGQQLLEKEMRDGKLIRPKLPTTREVIMANAAFKQGLYDEKIVHMGQPSLAQSVSNCEERAIGSNGGFGYRSIKDGVEIALLDSVILAHWACSTGKEHKKQRISY